MCEVRDPAITLFGHKIPVPHWQIPAESGCKLYSDSGTLPVLEMVDESREATDMEFESPPALEYAEQHMPFHLGEDAENYTQFLPRILRQLLIMNLMKVNPIKLIWAASRRILESRAGSFHVVAATA